ncbi:ester cyclase [Undibacterium sp. TJN19]|uniref:ester cyclase n=1 Tax=Undibacterium sp. TJN19 TaxID=3413055 RepID=UPI003BF3A03D
MTANELKAIVRRFNIEVIQDGKRASFDELMNSDFINKSAPEGAPAGAESLWDFFQNVLRPALSNFQVTIHDQIAEADKVTTRKTLSGLHTGPLLGIAPTGRQVAIDVIDIVRIRNGKYVEHWGQNSLPGVLTALRAG